MYLNNDYFADSQPIIEETDDPHGDVEVELGLLEVIALAASDGLYTHLTWQRHRGGFETGVRADWPGDLRGIATLGPSLYMSGVGCTS